MDLSYMSTLTLVSKLFPFSKQTPNGGQKSSAAKTLTERLATKTLGEPDLGLRPDLPTTSRAPACFFICKMD